MRWSAFLAAAASRPARFPLFFGKPTFPKRSTRARSRRSFAPIITRSRFRKRMSWLRFRMRLRAMDLPTMDGINTYFVSRETRRAGVKVALSGLGGDEVFAGYSSFRTVPRMERFAQFWKQLPRFAAQSVRLGCSLRSLRRVIRIANWLPWCATMAELLHPYFLEPNAVHAGTAQICYCEIADGSSISNRPRHRNAIGCGAR